VEDRGLQVDIFNEELVRGGTGRFSFVLRNTGEEAIELITALAQGSQPSPDIRFYLTDNDGVVLSSAPFLQVTGSDVITRPDGATVARLLPGENFSSDPVEMIIPLGAPDDVKIRLEIDEVIHYEPVAKTLRTKGEEAGPLSGPGTVTVESRTVKETSYTPRLTMISPDYIINNGDSTVTINGNVTSQDTGVPMFFVPVRVAVSGNTGMRTMTVYTDKDGVFTAEYQPTSAEKGQFEVCATHPAISDRCKQDTFYLANLDLQPQSKHVEAVRNVSQTVDIDFNYTGRDSLNNLQFVYDPALQPDPQTMTGITLNDFSQCDVVEPGQTGHLSFSFLADSTAPDQGHIILAAASNETADDYLKLFSFYYSLSDGQPKLDSQPKEVVVGLHQGELISETVTVENIGGKDAGAVEITLVPLEGAPAPQWIHLVNGTDIGEIRPGETKEIGIAITPDSNIPYATYKYSLCVNSSSGLALEIPIYVTVTSAETGNGRIYAYDPYIWQNDTNGQRIEGLSDAHVVLQHSTIYTLMYEGLTDENGNCDFNDLPVGLYNYTVNAKDHHTTAGTIRIMPGITTRREAFLSIAAVSIEWSVEPTTFTDKYEVKLETTYKTNVPEPVIVISPAYLTLPDMVESETFYGEYEITNHGLATAKECFFYAEFDDPDFSIDILGEMPAELNAGEKVVIDLSD